ncbi:MAG: PilN domain-containing protein [Planctomycetota bacterium]
MIDHIDLMPDEYRSRLGDHRVRRQAIGIFVIGMITILSFWLNIRAETDRRQTELNELQTELATLRAEADEVRSTAAAASELQNQFNTYHRLALPVEMSEIVACMSSLLPDGIVINDLRINLMQQQVSRAAMEAGSGKPRAPSGGSSKDEKTEIRRVLMGECSGLATSDVHVARFLGELDRHVLFERPQMDFSRTVERDDRRVREFRVTFEIHTTVIYDRQPESVPLFRSGAEMVTAGTDQVDGRQR